MGVVITIMVLVIITLLLTGSGNSGGVLQKQSKRSKSSIKPFIREKLSYRLRGVGNYGRIEAFNKVEKNEIVIVQFEKFNSHDKNALGVYLKTGEHLGYIPKSQWKLIVTLKEDPNNLAFVTGKFYLPENENYDKPYFGIDIELWAGFPLDELKKNENSILLRKEYLILKDKFHQKLSTLRESISTDYKQLLFEYESLAKQMYTFNSKSIAEFQFKIPLNEITTLTAKNKDFKKTLELFDNFFDKSNLSSINKEKVLLRINKIKKSLQLPT